MQSVVELIDLTSALGSLIGGLAAAGSIVFAVYSLKSQQRERAIDEIRASLLEIKLVFRDLDLRNWNAIFSDISERYNARLQDLFKDKENKNDVLSALKLRKTRVSVTRLAEIANTECRLRQKRIESIKDLEAIGVKLGQKFPISAEIVMQCSLLLHNQTLSLTGTDFLYDIVEDEGGMKTILEVMEEADSKTEFVFRLATLPSDYNIQYLSEKGKAVAMSVEFIVDSLGSVVSSKRFEELRQLEDFEKSKTSKIYPREETITKQIRKCLLEIQYIFEKDEWNKMLSEVTKLDHTLSQ